MAAALNQRILAGSIMFLLYWLVRTHRVKATAEKQRLWCALAHRFSVGLGWWMLTYPKWPSPINFVIISHADWMRVSGAAICGCGLFVTMGARRTLEQRCDFQARA